MTEQLDTNEFDKTKLLWKKYRTSVVTIICLVLIVIVSWQYWQKRQLQNDVEAIELYQKMMLISENVTGNSDIIINQAQNIINLYPKSIYSDFARLEIARQSVLKDDLAQAVASLQEIANNSINPNVQAIAKLRLARIQMAQNQINDAITTLNSIKLTGFSLSKAMLLGDAYFANKDYSAAQTQWELALKETQKPELTDIKNLLQIKIDNLAALK
ncbi:YfgM family protein [Fastidiosibacter lacustris]|uniref:YfgM family protein n=1 Tax=Fastidiosibacter lacustris TaxID=2056695 RepID=UPI000E3533C5|nr:tetratricopeptide repeat protein [Fastidiosibacter lacustris]